MKLVRDGYEHFHVCDFCERNGSYKNVDWIEAVGDKGICNLCITQLAYLISRTKDQREGAEGENK